MRDTQIWPLTLAYLREQITRATFATWLEPCTGQVADNRLIILTQSAFAKDFLTTHYNDIIQKAVHAIAGRDDIRITYDVRTDDQQDAGAVMKLVSFDPARRGFTQVSNYAIRFWQPYIGQDPFVLWVTLRSFVYEANTSNCWPSIRTLAGTCFRGHRCRVRGRQRKHPQTGDTYRQEGALQTLEQHKLVWWTRRDVTFGDHTFLQYIFNILDSPPLLTPNQVETLPKNIQRKHDEWMVDANLDQQQWRQLDFDF